MIATRAHSRSATPIRGVVIKTVLPRSRMPRMSSQITRRDCGSSPVVSSSRNTISGSLIDQRQGDEQPLLLPAGERHEPCAPFVGEPELFQKLIAVHRLRVQRRPEIHCLPNLDSLLELRLLELHANPVL